MRTILAGVLLLAASAATARADDEVPTAPAQGTASPVPVSQVPPAADSHDAAPPVAPSAPTTSAHLVEPASSPSLSVDTLPPDALAATSAKDGPVRYAREGVTEIGGSAGIALANDSRDVNVSPSIGWFVTNNLELSGILSLSNMMAGNQSTTVWAAMIEPSYHYELNRTTFAFAGFGMGAAYDQQLGPGVAVAPHVGLNILMGHSGVLSPSLSYQYTGHGTITQDDYQMPALTNALRMNVGYTTMW